MMGPSNPRLHCRFRKYKKLNRASSDTLPNISLTLKVDKSRARLTERKVLDPTFEIASLEE